MSVPLEFMAILKHFQLQERVLFHAILSWIDDNSDTSK